jgi:hypothetical protein
MVPADISPWKRGSSRSSSRGVAPIPAAFELRKFTSLDGSSYRVHVVGPRRRDGLRGGTRHGVDRPVRQRHGQRPVRNEGRGRRFPRRWRPRSRRSKRELAQKGLAGALGVLNRRVPHRFTAVYRLVGHALHNIATIDKHLHLDPLDLKVVPLQDSFCQFVLRDGLFLTRDSGTDPRLSGHPYSGIVGCYAGVRIRDREGQMAGTLCHFDLDSFDLTDDEYLLLDRAASLVRAFLAA